MVKYEIRVFNAEGALVGNILGELKKNKKDDIRKGMQILTDLNSVGEIWVSETFAKKWGVYSYDPSEKFAHHVRGEDKE